MRNNPNPPTSSSPDSSLSSGTQTPQSISLVNSDTNKNDTIRSSLVRTHSLDGMMLLKKSLSTMNAASDVYRNRSPSEPTMLPPQHHYGSMYAPSPGIIISAPRIITPQDPTAPVAVAASSSLSTSPIRERRRIDEGDILESTPLLPLSKSDEENPKQSYFDDNDRNQHQHHTMSTPTRNTSSSSTTTTSSSNKNSFLYIFIYAMINTVMSVPCLYGYASVVFNHTCFQPYMSTLSKLVIWSSAVHQLIFVLVSTISFAKAEVQDAGLIFLSTISNFIASSILNEDPNHDSNDNNNNNIQIKQILTTTLVGIAIATSVLGIILVLLGRLGWARVVAFLPLPVVGGYLAFIGYFCVVAGLGLCTSKSGLVDGNIFSDIRVITDLQTFPLAVAGLVAGMIMTIVTRYSTSDAALPITMIAIPLSFYIFLFVTGTTMEEAREGQWVGPLEPPSNVLALFQYLDLSQIRWEYIFSSKVITTWLGMTFVVGFSSCLDVAAISMDIGEVLDMNKELVTVGFSNVVSGVLLGQTGSYIFSQTLFTYRTGCHTRWVGVFCAIFFLSTVFSSVNFLEITPLFFLGSTLVFLGTDLLFIWLVEVRHKLLLSEYIVLLATFAAIQIVGIDAGIIVGVIVAVIDYVVTSANISTLRQVKKRSRAVWLPDQRKFLQDIGYESRRPKIVTLEVKGTVFFGSSMQLLTNMLDEIGVSATPTDMLRMSLDSPLPIRSSGHTGTPPDRRHEETTKELAKSLRRKKHSARFVILDLFHVQSLDASAARGCFLQMVKISSKQGIFVCASGANLRVDWILRTHNVAYSVEEGEAIKEKLRNPHFAKELLSDSNGKLLLFETLNEALETCENKLILEMDHLYSLHTSNTNNNVRGALLLPPVTKASSPESKPRLSTIFNLIIGEDDLHREALQRFDNSSLIKNIYLRSGETIFEMKEKSESFYAVLLGQVGLYRGLDVDDQQSSQSIISGAGSVSYNRQTSSRIVHSGKNDVREMMAILQVGGIFGYVDFALERPRSFSAVSGAENTIVAEIKRSAVERLRVEDREMYYIIEKVLLQTSLMELANIDQY